MVCAMSLVPTPKAAQSRSRGALRSGPSQPPVPGSWTEGGRPDQPHTLGARCLPRRAPWTAVQYSQRCSLFAGLSGEIWRLLSEALSPARPTALLAVFATDRYAGGEGAKMGGKKRPALERV